MTRRIAQVENPALGVGVVESRARATDAPAAAACKAAAGAMLLPPYSAKLIVSLDKATAYRIRFEQPLPPAVAECQLATFPKRASSGAVIKNNRFHDSCGTGGRVLIKASHTTVEGNTMNDFGIFTVTSEQEWLEGSLGLRNISIESNVLDGHPHIMPGIVGVTCVNNTFIENGTARHVTGGCA